MFKHVTSKKPDDAYMADADSTALWAQSNKGDTTRLGVTGFCRGARQSWLYAAHNPNLRAAVAWYGPIKGPTSDIRAHTVMDIADAWTRRRSRRCKNRDVLYDRAISQQVT